MTSDSLLKNGALSPFFNKLLILLCYKQTILHQIVYCLFITQ
jgi:hypothetical protein